MKITLLDWVVVAVYFLANLAIGLYYRKKASASTGDFFVSGREVSWWLAGTSMVAATFAADTPLAVTGFVATQGIAGNWIWWSFLFSGMMTVFFFARLWRRSEVITDVEFVELRYSGKAAAFLRGFRALYFGVLMNCLIVGWVNLAMEKILGVVLGVSQYVAVMIIFGIIAFTFLYTFISGLWGVLWTDFIQFIIKMTMVTVLAYYAVEAVGGMAALKHKLSTVDAERVAAHGGAGSILSFFPTMNSAWMPFVTFAMYLGVQWWANWYPGAEPGGGGYIAQRIFCAKNEKHSLWATLWFNIAQYAIRPWPWIITALASVVLYPTLKDKEIGYIKVWVDYLPGGWNGLMLAAFAAAYMSTIATQMNWGSSYIVNDFYRRFLTRPRSRASRLWKLVLWICVLLGAFAGSAPGALVVNLSSLFPRAGPAGPGSLLRVEGEALWLLGIVLGGKLTFRICTRLFFEGRDEKHYVFVSKLATAALAILGAVVSLLMASVGGAWELLIGIGAGTGAVYLLRWYWWRINAWSEVSAMSAALVTTLVLHTGAVRFAGSEPDVFAKSVLVTVVVTSIVWVVTTFLTEPDPQPKLLEFYRKVRPGVAGWRPIAKLAPEVPATRDGWYNLMDWLLGCLMVYMAMFGAGKIVLGSYGIGVLLLLISAISGYTIYWDFSRRGWEKLSGKA